MDVRVPGVRITPAEHYDRADALIESVENDLGPADRDDVSQVYLAAIAETLQGLLKLMMTKE